MIDRLTELRQKAKLDPIAQEHKYNADSSLDEKAYKVNGKKNNSTISKIGIQKTHTLTQDISLNSTKGSDSSESVSPKFNRYSTELNIITRRIQEIREMNEQVQKNDQLQRKEVDHQKKIERDKETQAIYNQLKQRFTEVKNKLENMKDEITIDKNENDIEEKEFEVLSLNIQGAAVNLKKESEESHRIYGQYRQNFKDVLVRQFMNIDGGATEKEEVERLVEDDPNVGIFHSKKHLKNY